MFESRAGLRCGNDIHSCWLLDFLILVVLKTCRLLELINTHATKTAIIREWSPFINRLWCSGGDLMVAQRRTELDMYLAPDKTIPTFVPHRCHSKRCLLNLPETYTGAPNQLKAIEYLEKKDEKNV